MTELQFQKIAFESVNRSYPFYPKFTWANVPDTAYGPYEYYQTKFADFMVTVIAQYPNQDYQDFFGRIDIRSRKRNMYKYHIINKAPYPIISSHRLIAFSTINELLYAIPAIVMEEMI